MERDQPGEKGKLLLSPQLHIRVGKSRLGKPESGGKAFFFKDASNFITETINNREYNTFFGHCFELPFGKKHKRAKQQNRRTRDRD